MFYFDHLHKQKIMVVFIPKILNSITNKSVTDEPNPMRKRKHRFHRDTRRPHRWWEVRYWPLPHRWSPRIFPGFFVFFLLPFSVAAAWRMGSQDGRKWLGSPTLISRKVRPFRKGSHNPRIDKVMPPFVGQTWNHIPEKPSKRRWIPGAWTTHLKNMRLSNWIIFARIGVKIKSM